MSAATTLGFIGGLGVGEMFVIGVVALLVFGKRLPEVARSIGNGVQEFRRGVQGVEQQVRDETLAALPGPAPAPRDAQPELSTDVTASAPPQSPSDSPSSASTA